MKILLLLTFFAFSFLNAGMINTTSNSSNEASMTEESLDIELKNVEKFHSEKEKEIQDKVQKNLESKKNIEPIYFEDVEFINSDNIKNLVCPPLTKEWQNKGYISRIDYLSPRSGQIMCSVLHSIDSAKPAIHKQAFINKSFLKKFENLKVDNQNYPSKIDKLAEKANLDFNNRLIVQSIQNSTIDDNKKLNYVDILDAIAGLNPEIIDIKKTIELQELSLVNGYYYSVNNSPAAVLKSELLETIRAASKEMLDDKGLGDFNPFDSPDTVNYLKNDPEKSQSLANAETVFMINWFFDISPILSLLLQWLAIAIIGWNMLYLGFKVMNDEKTTKHREVMISGAFVMFLWATFAASSDIRITDESNHTIEISKTRIQDFISALYMETNAIADDLVESTIANYLRKFHQQHNIHDTSSIHKIDDEIVKLNEELNMLNIIEKEICSQQFDLGKIRNENLKSGQNSQYLGTENQAQKLFKNPYQELLKDDYLEKISDKNIKLKNGFMSLSACSHNLEQTRFIKSKLIKYEKKIDNYNSVENLELQQAKIELLNTMMWNMYDEYGYFSIAFIPILESINRVFNVFEEKENEYRELLFNSNNQLENLAIFASKNAFLLAFFDLSSIQTIISKMASLVPTSWIPFIGQTLQNATELAATLILIDILSDMAETLKIGVFIVLSIVVLMFAWIQKLTTYLIAPFSILVAFSQQQHQKISEIFGNIIFITIKPILIIFSIVLALVSISIFASIFHFFMNDAAEIIGAQSGFFSYLTTGFFLGFMKIIYYILQFVIIYQLIIKQPTEWADWLQFRIKDSSESVSQMIENKLDRKI